MKNAIRYYSILVLGGLLLIGATSFIIFKTKPKDIKKNNLVGNLQANNPPDPTVGQISKGYSLIIPKLRINSPIVLNVSGIKEDEYLPALQHGIAHYKGTVLPGQNGNTFLFAHSSLNSTKNFGYNEIFKRLNDLNLEDTIEIKAHASLLLYRVTNARIVEADDTSVLANTDQETLTLMTCWPPGTTEKRYIVSAQRVY